MKFAVQNCSDGQWKAIVNVGGGVSPPKVGILAALRKLDLLSEPKDSAYIIYKLKGVETRCIDNAKRGIPAYTLHPLDED